MKKHLKITALSALLSLTLVSSSFLNVENGTANASALTPEEVSLQHQNLKVAYDIIGNYEDYSTLYVDDNNDIVLSISKEDAKTEKIKKELKEKLPKVKFSKSKYSTKELKNASFDLYKKIPELKKESANVVSTEIDEELDKVVVVATELPEKSREKLIKEYGDMLEIKVDKGYTGEIETSRTSNNSVLGGGIAANNSSFTITATAKKGSDRYLITVGHALTGNGTTVIKQNTTDVGVDWAKAVSHDIGLIKVTATGRTISNKIIRNSTDYDYKYTSTGSVTQGSTYCKSGIKTGYQCSKVISTSHNGLYQDTIKLENPNWTFQDNGDSGSPLFSSSSLSYVLYGIMSTKSTETGPDAFATATKISYLNYYWSDYSLYTSDTAY